MNHAIAITFDRLINLFSSDLIAKWDQAAHKGKTLTFSNSSSRYLHTIGRLSDSGDHRLGASYILTALYLREIGRFLLSYSPITCSNQ